MTINTCSTRAFVCTFAVLFLLGASANAQSNIYVSNLAGNNVSVVNPSTDSVVASIPVPSGPTGLAMTPNGTSVYVACQSANVVAVISTTTNDVVSTIGVTPGTTQVAISPNGAFAYAISPAGNTISVIETGSNNVVATVRVGTRPTAVAFNRAGTRAYVTNLYSANVSVIDTTTKSVVATYDAHSGPSGVAVSPDGLRLYVTNQYSGDVTVHDTATGAIVQCITGFAFPNGVAVTPNGGRALVTNGNAGTVSVINTSSNSVVGTVSVGSLPTAVAMNEDGSRAYVTNEYSFSLSVIDPAQGSLICNIQRVGVYPIGVAAKPAGGVVNPPPTCTFTLSSTLASFGAGGGNGSFNVSGPSGCGWSASTNVTWISIVSGLNGSGNGTVSFTVSANPDSNGRTGLIIAGGQTFTVTQSGLSCGWTLSATSASVSAPGGTGSVNVTTLPGCVWSAGSDSSWLTINTTSGSGSGYVVFIAAANPNRDTRTGKLTIAGQTFTVTQAGTAFSGIRLNCGGTAFTDSQGKAWSADDQRSRSITMSSISGTTDPAIYQKESWSTGPLEYQFSIPNGSYTVKLKFAEFYLTRAGQRVVSISLNGNTVQSNFDILAQTSPNTAIDQTYGVNVTDGKITIRLTPVTGTAKLSGIEIN